MKRRDFVRTAAGLLVPAGMASAAPLSIVGGPGKLFVEQGGGGDPGTPDYSPFYAQTWGSGTVGNQVSGISGSRVRYSDDIAGPFGESRVAKLSMLAGGDDFGGALNGYSLPAVSAGDEMWVRIYHYFPSDFCAAYQSGGGDGWGRIKWFRLQYGGTSERLTMQLGNFSSDSCNTSGPTLAGATHELMLDHSSQNSFLTFSANQVIPRDQWVALQWNIKFGTTRANSYIRMWMDETYMGDLTLGAATMADNALAGLVYGDYYNGNAYQDVTWYISNAIITKERPPGVDAGGRPFIPPSHDAADFL